MNKRLLFWGLLLGLLSIFTAQAQHPATPQDTTLTDSSEIFWVQNINLDPKADQHNVELRAQNFEADTISNTLDSLVLLQEKLALEAYKAQLAKSDSLSRALESQVLKQISRPVQPQEGQIESTLPVMLLLPVVNQDGVIPRRFFEIRMPEMEKALRSAEAWDAMPQLEAPEFSSAYDLVRFDDWMLHHIAQTMPNLMKRSASDLLSHRVVSRTVGAGNMYVGAGHDASTPSVISTEVAIPALPLETKYWFPAFESTIQFSQNHVSTNWHKGGASNINLFSKQLLKLDYRRDKLNWANELEWRIVMLSTIENTIANYKISEDIARFRSNIGYKAFQNWFYSFDAEVKTQFFSIRSEDKAILYSSLFAPVTFTAGIGMKYQIDKKWENHYGRRFRFNVNLAPLAYDYKWTHSHDIDMKRHGLDPSKPYYSAIGSMMRADMIFNISPLLTWESKFYYNTSYKRVETEWENGLTFSFNRYFSSRILLMLRFDDATPRGNHRFGRLQFNELFTFGFNLKL